MGVSARGLLAPLVALCVSCAEPQTPKAPTVSLRMAGAPGDATVIIDEEAVGTLDLVAARGVALPPGVHHVTVRANGYFPFDKEVAAALGSPPIRIEVALTPVPD
jgi:hypothetical protein